MGSQLFRFGRYRNFIAEVLDENFRLRTCVVVVMKAVREELRPFKHSCDE
jgi:hypothetical protein